MTTDVKVLVSDEYDLTCVYVDGRLLAVSEESYSYDDTVLEQLVVLLGGTIERGDDAVMGNEEWNGDLEELAQTWEQIVEFRLNKDRYQRDRERREDLDQAETLRRAAQGYLDQAEAIERKWR